MRLIKKIAGSNEYGLFISTNGKIIPSRAFPKPYKTKKGALKALSKWKKL